MEQYFELGFNDIETIFKSYEEEKDAERKEHIRKMKELLGDSYESISEKNLKLLDDLGYKKDSNGKLVKTKNFLEGL